MKMYRRVGIKIVGTLLIILLMVMVQIVIAHGNGQQNKSGVDINSIETKIGISGNVNLTGEARTSLNVLVAEILSYNGSIKVKILSSKNGNVTNETTVETAVKGVVTEQIKALVDTLAKNVRKAVEESQGKAKIEIKIEHKITDKSDDEMIDEKTREDKGKKGNGKKVAVCHTPHENSSRAHTIYISKNAVKSHLAHGDKKGLCKEPA